MCEILKTKHMPLSWSQSNVGHITERYITHCITVVDITSDTVVCSLLAILAVCPGLNLHSVLIMAGKQREAFRAAGPQLSTQASCGESVFPTLWQIKNRKLKVEGEFACWFLTERVCFCTHACVGGRRQECLQWLTFACFGGTHLRVISCSTLGAEIRSRDPTLLFCCADKPPTCWKKTRLKISRTRLKVMSVSVLFVGSYKAAGKMFYIGYMKPPTHTHTHAYTFGVATGIQYGWQLWGWPIKRIQSFHDTFTAGPNLQCTLLYETVVLWGGVVSYD